jgi:hypothetical protein
VRTERPQPRHDAEDDHRDGPGDRARDPAAAERRPRAAHDVGAGRRQAEDEHVRRADGRTDPAGGREGAVQVAAARGLLGREVAVEPGLEPRQRAPRCGEPGDGQQHRQRPDHGHGRRRGRRHTRIIAYRQDTRPT